MSGQLVVSIFAFVISLASFLFAWAASRRAAKAEEVKNLLGEKETVGFGALKLLRDGLPGEHKEATDEESPGSRKSVRFSGLRSFGHKLLVRARKPWDDARVRRDSQQRTLVIRALMAACLFERSDRARSLCYRVIAKHLEPSSTFKEEFVAAFNEFKETIDSMDQYKFEKNEFNPSSARQRLKAVEKIFGYFGYRSGRSWPDVKA